MKLSAWISVSDLVSMPRTPLEQALDVFVAKKRSMFQTLSHDYIFQSLKQAGVDGMELRIPKHTSNKNIKEVEQITAKYNLPVQSIHQPNIVLGSLTLHEITRLCNIANQFSVNVITLHAGSLGKSLHDADFIYQLKKLQKKHTVTFGIENMQRMPFPLPNPLYTHVGSAFIEMIKAADLSITLDMTHLAQAGGDMLAFYRTNKHRIVNIHMSDFKKTWSNSTINFPDHLHLLLGKGELPIKSFLKTLKKENYKGFITMEINSNLEGLCNSAKLIKGLTEN